ncbi:MAG: hypothetical protein Q7R56_00775 [Nanoarchaeota archaeon]|nr:hypothetical protein [Nanoarchaeota archaeon]
MADTIQLPGYETFFPNQLYGKKELDLSIGYSFVTSYAFLRFFRYNSPTSTEAFSYLQMLAKHLLGQSTSPVPKTPKLAISLRLLGSFSTSLLHDIAEEDPSLRKKLLAAYDKQMAPPVSAFRMHYGSLPSNPFTNPTTDLNDFDTQFEDQPLNLRGIGYQLGLEYTLVDNKITSTPPIEEYQRVNKVSPCFSDQDRFLKHKKIPELITMVTKTLGNRDLTIVPSRSAQSHESFAVGIAYFALHDL